LNSVQQYVRGLLDQLPLPLNLGRLAAFIDPPNPGDGTQPAVYVWGSTQQEFRQTMPRARPGNLASGGFKKVEHAIDLWLIWFGDAEDPRASSMFPLVIDSINKQLRNTLMPVQGVTDPDTGDVSTILSIGEKIDSDYAPVHSLEDERWLVYNAHIICHVTELLQA
jgi:hypothetical protein